MNIHPRPEQEIEIQRAIRAGLIISEIDALDIGLQRLQDLLTKQPEPKIKKKKFSELFELIKGDDLDLSRNKSTGRQVDL